MLFHGLLLPLWEIYTVYDTSLDTFRQTSPEVIRLPCAMPMMKLLQILFDMPVHVFVNSLHDFFFGFGLSLVFVTFGFSFSHFFDVPVDRFRE